MRRTKDLTGKKIGLLTAVSYVGSVNKRSHWNCLCECGNHIQAEGNNLIRGHTLSCGCVRSHKRLKNLRNELLTVMRTVTWTVLPTIKTRVRTREYGIWNAMKTRCNNDKIIPFEYYGGRGIKVCERWESFDNFIADMGPAPSNKHSIDRIDTNGNYEPGNCKWSTVSEQAVNKRTNVFVEINGERLTLSQAMKKYNMTRYEVSKLRTTPAIKRNLRTKVYART
jgi:hypothetical protein